MSGAPTTANGPGGGKGLLAPAIATGVALAILVGLGVWQLERKAWKEGLIAALDRRLAEAPVALPPASEWAALAAARDEFTRVTLRLTFAGGADALVYAGSSGLRDDVKSPGYFVFSPARLADGRQIVVNRGFVPSKPPPAPLPGEQEIVGALRWPEAPSLFVADHDTAGEVWTVRDPLAMATQRGWGEVAPFYIEQEAPVPPGGLPHPARLAPRLRNDHLQYALTWFALALVLIVVFAVFARRRLRPEPLVDDR